MTTTGKFNFVLFDSRLEVVIGQLHKKQAVVNIATAQISAYNFICRELISRRIEKIRLTKSLQTTSFFGAFLAMKKAGENIIKEEFQSAKGGPINSSIPQN